MALLASPLGSIKNRLGNMVIYQREHSVIVRAMPLRIRNPRSVCQQELRMRFRAASTLVGHLFPSITHNFGTTVSVSLSAFTCSNI